MKRSLINTLLADGEDFFAANSVALPSFALWRPDEFSRRVSAGHENVVASRLGWLVSDFALGDFAAEGLVAFCASAGGGAGNYAERLLILRDRQRIPDRFHRRRVKDLINCGPGNLCLRLHRTTPSDTLDETANLQVAVDGAVRKLAPGARLLLRPGERVRIDPLTFHECQAEAGDLIAREISTATDEMLDSFFLPQIALAMSIVEDEPARRLLVSDYPDQFPELAAAA
ncbi:MAG: D-lyxose/D-mannose family sugar isomerase [Betaproteobacteria bacterium]|nr:D-lyxose/D-mannose family sugar isomerase [Betaproteobacteria bacterium]